jgi:hypothetical protein
VEEHGLAGAGVGEYVGEVTLDDRPARRIAEVRREMLGARMRAAGDADDSGRGIGSGVDEGGSDARRRPGDPDNQLRTPSRR